MYSYGGAILRVELVEQAVQPGVALGEGCSRFGVESGIRHDFLVHLGDGDGR
mgnify:CR=1 FL=1